MSFAEKTMEKFATVFDRSDFQAQDPLVKINYVPKGNNIIFGRGARESDTKDLIFIGKVLENTVGKNYLSANCWLDTRFPHVIYITGTRGSGKSFDLGVLLEGISELSNPSPIQNGVTPICSVLIDTQSQFWTLGYKPNAAVPENARQLADLKAWNIAPNNLSKYRLLIPPQSVPITGNEEVFTIQTSQVRHEEWCALLGEDVYGPQGHILARTIEALSDHDFSVEEMITYINLDANWPNMATSSRAALEYKLDDYRRTGLFAGQGLKPEDYLVPGQCTILMLRDLRNVDKALVTGIIARQLFQVMGEYHKKEKVNKFFQKGHDGPSLPSRVWLLIDEAHVIAPADQASPARSALVEYVKRGRDAGLSLALATQQPSAVDDGILSQVNITFSHRLTFQQDISAAVRRIPTKLLAKMRYSGIDISDFGDMLRYLDSGQCFFGDHNTSRVLLLQVRPRVTSHGGYSPS